MNNFNILFQQVLYNNTKQQQQKQYRSLEEFKHFCDNLNLITKELKSDIQSNFITINLYKLNNNNEERFEYYNKYNPHFYNQYKNIIDTLEDYKNKYNISLDGTPNSKIIFFS